MHRRLLSRALAAMALAGLVAAGGCGGSGSEAPAPPPVQASPPPGSATVGGATQTAAVTIDGIGGASVVVPPEALAEAVTVRIAADTTGAPPLPAGLVPRGAVLALTPHDVAFAVPVRVRIPAPAVTLADGERLVLAKASPQGDWVPMADTQLVNGQLELEVTSFSFFVPVVIQTVPANLQPWSATMTLACGTQDCQRLVGPADVAATVTTNNGLLPPSCTAVNARVEIQTWYRNTASTVSSLSRYAFDTVMSSAGGTAVRHWSANLLPLYGGEMRARLVCAGSVVQSAGYATLKWQRGPDSSIHVLPVALSLPGVGSGGSAVAQATLTGGGQEAIEGFDPISYPNAPRATSQATVDWERSDDDGASWRFVATSYQTLATPLPFGNETRPWDYWTVRHEFSTEGNRSGRILFRVRACVDARRTVDLGRTVTVERRCRTGEAGTANIVAAASPPVFTQQPRALLVLAGQTATLGAVATGLPAPTLVWQTRPANSLGGWSDATGGNGANSGSYTTPVLGLADNGTQYRAVAANSGGTEFSAPVTVSVGDAPVAPQITSNLSAIRTLRGGDATLAVAVRGTEPLSYEWRVGGTVVPGQNAPVLNLQSIQVGSTVSVTVSNGAGSVTSREVAVTLVDGAAPLQPLGIVRQPLATTVTVGNTATLAVQTEGGGSIGYQWQRNGVDIAGATEAVYALASAQAADAGNYRVIVSRGADTLASSVVALTVNAAGPQPETLNISFQPTGLSLNPGQTALFAVAGTGAGPLRYQWLREGVPISGATTPVLKIDAVAAGDAGNYTVHVMDTTGTVVSNAAGLVVLPAPGAPQFTSFVMPVGSVVGDTPRIATTVAASPPAQCLWLRNGELITGANDCSGYTTPPLTLADNGAVYTAVAYNAGGAAVSGAFALSVRQPAAPAILSHPTDATTTEGGAAVFSATYSGEPPPQRRWFVNGVELPVAFLVPFTAGACGGGYDVTGGSLRLLQVTAGCDGATVHFVATNSLGSTTSNTARLTVTPSVPVGALTATQVVAGHEWSLVLRPDRTVWGWGGLHKVDGTVVISNLAPGDQARRPVQMYPAVLTDVRQIAGWYDGFWAMTGEPGSAGSRVLHWGNARSANDGRGADGLGNPGLLPSFRVNASPVPMLERRTVNGSLQSVPVDRVCSVAATSDRTLLIRALDGFGSPTDCAPGSAKTVWVAGTLTQYGADAVGVVLPVQGLPAGIPARVITAQHSAQSSSGPAMVLMEDGSLHGWGMNIGNQFGLALPANTGTVGSDVAPQSLPGAWGEARVAAFSYVGLIVGRSDGSAMVSGRNDGGELGLGPQASGTVNNGPLPLLAAAGVPLDGVDALASAQVQVSLALRQGRILAWGAANQPLQGGSTSALNYPRQLPASGDGWRALSAGHAHALAIAANGVAYTWGNGLRGALGNGQDSGAVLAPAMLTAP